MAFGSTLGVIGEYIVSISVVFFGLRSVPLYSVLNMGSLRFYEFDLPNNYEKFELDFEFHAGNKLDFEHRQKIYNSGNIKINRGA